MGGELQIALKTMAKILVVDDDPTVVDILKEHLKLRGHDILTASNGEAAVETARSERPDVVLLDFEMPGMAGEGAFERFRAHPAMAEIPVVFLSSLPLNRQVGRVPVARDVRFLRKPVTAAALFEAIDGLLERSP
ncbi:MAG: response regulator [Elusimicrobia bacterium]|nr:response regulator [Elusimicrobiota bacterium]